MTILQWNIWYNPRSYYKDVGMRLFKKYAPAQIAKHISRFFKGRIYIHGVGKFEFDNGKLLIPAEPETRHYRAVKEINQEVTRMRCLAM